MPTKTCCCGQGSYVAIPCRSWAYISFVGYQGLTGVRGASGIAGYNNYFGPSGYFSKSKGAFGLSGPWEGWHPFYKFYEGGFAIGGGDALQANLAPLKITGFTGCISTQPGGPAWGGYGGNGCEQAILETDNERPVIYKLWGAGGGGINTALFGGNGAFTQVDGIYNSNNIACVGLGGYGENLGKSVCGWTGPLDNFEGNGGQGFPCWGGGGAYVSSRFEPNPSAIVGSGGGVGSRERNPGHGGATSGRDAAGKQGGKGAQETIPGQGGLGARDGEKYTGGRGSTGSPVTVYEGGGGGGGGLAGGGGGGLTGYGGGGGDSTVAKYSRDGTDNGPPNICDPYFWVTSSVNVTKGNPIFAGLGGFVSMSGRGSDLPRNNADYGMSGKVVTVYSSLRCPCKPELDTIPEKTYICLNEDQYQQIYTAALSDGSCPDGLSFDSGLSAYGGLTANQLFWQYGNSGGEVVPPVSISFYYNNELYYMVGRCPVLCDPAYQIPVDATFASASCRQFGDCCKAFFAFPYCKVIDSNNQTNCFDPVTYYCPEECIPGATAEPFYACIEEGVEYPEGLFWTKKNNYYYQVSRISGWLPFGDDLYKIDTIGEIIEQEPCCSETQENCYRPPNKPTNPTDCCVVVNNPFTDAHPGIVNINVTTKFFGPVKGDAGGNCVPFGGCCIEDTMHSDSFSAQGIKTQEYRTYSSPQVQTRVDYPELPGVCETIENCPLPYDKALYYYTEWDGGQIENPYVPIFKIESYCNCYPTCFLPELILDSYGTFPNCENYQNSGVPVVIVSGGNIQNIVDALNSVSGGKYTTTVIDASTPFWFGMRSTETNIPGDEWYYFDEDIYDPDGLGRRCIRTYYARSPYYTTYVQTCGSQINLCDCIYRPSPGFKHSNGQPDNNYNPGCAVQTSYKRLVDWQQTPSANMFISSEIGTLCGDGFNICTGFYNPCIVSAWNGTNCTLTAIGG